MTAEQLTSKSSRKRGGRAKLLDYGVSLAIATAALLIVLNTAGEKAVHDWTMVKTNLDPDWVPPASKTVTSAKAEGGAQYASNTTDRR